MGLELDLHTMRDIGHFYVARRADLPHYQEVFSKFIYALESYKDDMPVYIYLNGHNTDHH
jgi:hypothetical protein